MTLTGTILDTIAAHKREEVLEAKSVTHTDELRSQCRDLPPTRGFEQALRAAPRLALIAEVKKASPTRGLLRDPFDPAEIAGLYAEGGATALSVLTDERFFQGSPGFLRQAREACPLPVLRKDFTLEEYQVYQSRALGADAILLIAALLSGQQMADLLGLARELDLDTLVEVHTQEEAGDVPAAATLVGVNNRDLKAFTVDLAVTEALAPVVLSGRPDRLLVSESGIHTRADVLRVSRAGAGAVLVGESLMRHLDPAAKVRELLGTRDGGEE
ncbi:MAG TPA: indole-3-glycerol phosphate synthase TrpC [Armatimonadota bacterium]|jgi:indole-3-glycerol phosphate synthase